MSVAGPTFSNELLDLPGVTTQLQFPPYYWETYEPVQSLFVLQIAMVLLGFFTVKWARRAWSLTLFFLGIITLDAFSWSVATEFYLTPSFGFWILIEATLFISIALVRVKNWMEVIRRNWFEFPA